MSKLKPFLTITSIFLAAITFVFTSCQTETQVEKANRENILLLGNTDEPKGLDPHQVSGVLEGNIIRALFEGLCGDHPSKNAVPVPGVAEKWEPNTDFTEWTFFIRKDAEWSDGKALTAEDFVFSYHRILSPELGAKYAEMLYFLKNGKEYNQNHKGYILCGLDSSFPVKWDILKECNFRGNDKTDVSKIKDKEYGDLSSSEKKTYIAHKGLDKLNKDQLNEVKSNTALFEWPESITEPTRTLVLDTLLKHFADGSPDLWEKAQVGVSAKSPTELVVNLRGPVPFLPEITKHYTWFPVPKHVILKYGKIDTRYTAWTEPENMVSNGPFKLKTWTFNHLIEVEKSPNYWDVANVHLNGIKYFPIKNSYTEARMFFDGQLHKTYSLAPEMITYAKEKNPEALRQEPYVGVNFLRINTSKEHLNKVKVRMALAAAIDRELIIENLLQGGQTPAHAIVPQTSDYTTPKTVGFDKTKAQKLLAEAGYPDGKGFPSDLKILTTPKETSVRLAEALQAMWKKNLNIDVRIEQREWGTFLTAQQELKYDIATGGWIGDFLDPTTFLDMWTKGNGNNNTAWHSEEYEAKLKLAERTADPKKRLEILKEAEATVIKDMPVLPLYWYTTNYLISENVKGWNPLLLNNQPYKHIRLENN